MILRIDIRMIAEGQWSARIDHGPGRGTWILGPMALWDLLGALQIHAPRPSPPSAPGADTP